MENAFEEMRKEESQRKRNKRRRKTKNVVVDKHALEGRNGSS